MKYWIIVIFLMFITAIAVSLWFYNKKAKKGKNIFPAKADEAKNFENVHQNKYCDNVFVKVEEQPLSIIKDESKLSEIKDSVALGQINNLIPNFAQLSSSVNTVSTLNEAVNSLNNAKDGMEKVNAVLSKQTLYTAEFPSNKELMKVKGKTDAFRGIFKDPNGSHIEGQAELREFQIPNTPDAQGISNTAMLANSVSAAMDVVSMVVGQYYMAQINLQLNRIGDDIAKISEFQDNEYYSKVLSLAASVRKLSDFKLEIIKNEDQRKIQLISLSQLENKCEDLLGQANLALKKCAKDNLKYKEYEAKIQEVKKWRIYQKILLAILKEISDLNYTLNLGESSREYCSRIYNNYSKDAKNTCEIISDWHKSENEKLKIEPEEMRRKRMGLEGGLFYLPGLIKDELKFKSINEETANIIIDQTNEPEIAEAFDNTDLYDKKVKLVSKDGKIYYYLPGDE